MQFVYSCKLITQSGYNISNNNKQVKLIVVSNEHDVACNEMQCTTTGWQLAAGAETFVLAPEMNLNLLPTVTNY